MSSATRSSTLPLGETSISLTAPCRPAHVSITRHECSHSLLIRSQRWLGPTPDIECGIMSDSWSDRPDRLASHLMWHGQDSPGVTTGSRQIRKVRDVSAPNADSRTPPPDNEIMASHNSSAIDTHQIISCPPSFIHSDNSQESRLL